MFSYCRSVLVVRHSVVETGSTFCYPPLLLKNKKNIKNRRIDDAMLKEKRLHYNLPSR
jgi:hypothetical protein